MAKLTPIDPATLGLMTLNGAGQEVTWELGTRDGSSPRKDHSPGRTSATQQLLCDWSKLDDAIKFFVGDSAVDFDTSPYSVSRRLPHPYPGDPYLIATSVSVSGHQFAGNQTGNLTYQGDYPILTNLNNYTKAKLDVSYTLETYNSQVRDAAVTNEYERYVSINETRSSAEYGTLPTGLINLIGVPGVAGGVVPISAAVGRIFPQEDFPITWHRVPYEAWGPGTGLYKRVYGDGNEMRPYLGSVNKSEFMGKPAGTLLFQNVRAIIEPSPCGGKLEWRLEFQTTYDPNCWNKKFYFAPNPADRSTRNGWYLVGTGTTVYEMGSVPDDYSIYNERNFGDLFVPGEIT